MIIIWGRSSWEQSFVPEGIFTRWQFLKIEVFVCVSCGELLMRVIHPLHIDAISPHPGMNHVQTCSFTHPSSVAPVIIEGCPVGIYFSFLLLLTTWAAFIWGLLWIRLPRPFSNASLLAHTHKYTCWVFTQEENCQSQESVCSMLLYNARRDDKWSHWYTVSPAMFDSSSFHIFTGTGYCRSVRLAVP